SLPAILHLPSHGTFRISQTGGTGWLEYQSVGRAIRITFPAATVESPAVEYRWELAEIHPPLPGLENEHAFDAVRRGWLNILQLSPTRRVLSNHTTSDTCAFCYYEYADLARLAPPLADGLTALDIVRQTL